MAKCGQLCFFVPRSHFYEPIPKSTLNFIKELLLHSAASSAWNLLQLDLKLQRKKKTCGRNSDICLQAANVLEHFLINLYSCCEGPV